MLWFPAKGTVGLLGVSRGATGSRLQGLYLRPVSGHQVWSAQRIHCDQMGKKTACILMEPTVQAHASIRGLTYLKIT